MEFMPEKAAGLLRLDYLSRQGPFLAAPYDAKSKFHPEALPDR